LETVHDGVQDHCCEICGKGFRYPCLLAKHMKSHMEKEDPIVVELPESALRGDGSDRIWDE
jgi:hypothetical protein